MKGKILLFLILLNLLSFILTLNSFAQVRINFKGNIDFVQKKFDVTFNTKQEQTVSLFAERISHSEYKFLLNTEHLRTPFFDLSTEISSLINAKEKKIKGTLGSQYTLINYKPISELSGSFEFSKNKLYINALTFGYMALNGDIEMSPPFNFNFLMKLGGIEMIDFLNFWSAKKGCNAKGNIFGEIKASGNPGKLFLKGMLKSTPGYVENVNFSDINLNIEGTYPQMQILNSTLSTQEGAVISFVGPFNLIKKDEFKKQFESLIFSPITNSNEKASEWIIKRIKDKQNGTTELKYRLKQESDKRYPQEKDSGMISVEKAIKF